MASRMEFSIPAAECDVSPPKGGTPNPDFRFMVPMRFRNSKLETTHDLAIENTMCVQGRNAGFPTGFTHGNYQTHLSPALRPKPAWKPALRSPVFRFMGSMREILLSGNSHPGPLPEALSYPQLFGTMHHFILVLLTLMYSMTGCLNQLHPRTLRAPASLPHGRSTNLQEPNCRINV